MKHVTFSNVDYSAYDLTDDEIFQVSGGKVTGTNLSTVAGGLATMAGGAMMIPVVGEVAGPALLAAAATTEVMAFMVETFG